MVADIITIGDEILIGQIVDTNSAWLAEQLNNAGVSVREITSISDSRRHIVSALDEAKRKADIIIITGGLGPTADDITKPTLTEYFGTRLIRNQSVLEHVTKLIEKHGFEVTENNVRQADVPEACTPLTNNNGTAPGMWFEENGKVFISMPGVPFEMKGITTDEVIPRLKTKFNLPTILHTTIQTFGIPESILANRISKWEESLPKNVKLAYLPSLERVRLRLSTLSSNKVESQKELDKLVLSVKEILGNAVFGRGDVFLENAIGKLLIEKGQTVASAESCTGGNVARLITSVSGSSLYFEGSVVAYSNRIKSEILGVKEETLTINGAVSEETVIEMANGVRKLMGSDYAIAISGVAGPEGGSEEKPVGTVWVAVCSENKTITKKYDLGKNRELTVRRASSRALNMLRLLVLES